MPRWGFALRRLLFRRSKLKRVSSRGFFSEALSDIRMGVYRSVLLVTVELFIRRAGHGSAVADDNAAGPAGFAFRTVRQAGGVVGSGSLHELVLFHLSTVAVLVPNLRPGGRRRRIRDGETRPRTTAANRATLGCRGRHRRELRDAGPE